MSGNGSGGGGGNGKGDGSMSRIQAAEARPLPRRFYAEVGIGVGLDGASVLLDGRPAKTPGKRMLSVPGAALATALAEEWAAQGERIDPATMPLTRLVNTAIDGVAGREAAVRAEVVKYALSDLLCYRAERPAGLAARQAALWDGALADAEARLGCRFRVTAGLMPVEQAGDVGDSVARAIEGLGAYELTALHVFTTLTGSALLALALVEKRMAPDVAWNAAHVDEDWQIAEWGEDAEAQRRRARRKAEYEAAARLVALLPAA